MTLPVGTTDRSRPDEKPSAGVGAPLLARVAARLAARVPTGDERGDVPGWVLVTLMTAALVAGIWALAGDALEGLFQDAIAMVTER